SKSTAISHSAISRCARLFGGVERQSSCSPTLLVIVACITTGMIVHHGRVFGLGGKSGRENTGRHQNVPCRLPRGGTYSHSRPAGARFLVSLGFHRLVTGVWAC